VSGFNAGIYIPTRLPEVRPAAEAALKSVAAGFGQTEIEVLPFDKAVTAHQRMESRALNGRIVLTPSSAG
jgi:NADPH2:quinone reductase